MMAELKPCPFCGGEADFVGKNTTIKCKACGGAFFVSNPLISRLEAKEAWNRRENGEIHKCVNEEVSIRPDGVHELSPHRFETAEKYRNVTVEILRCADCGEISIGWYRQENTEVCDD